MSQTSLPLDPMPWTLVSDALPPVVPEARIPQSAIVEIRLASGRQEEAFHMPCIGGGWRTKITWGRPVGRPCYVPTQGTVVSWRPLAEAASTASTTLSSIA